MGPIVRSRFTKPKVKVLCPLKLETSIGYLMIFSLGMPTASRVDNDIVLMEDLRSSIALLSSTPHAYSHVEWQLVIARESSSVNIIEQGCIVVKSTFVPRPSFGHITAVSSVGKFNDGFSDGQPLVEVKVHLVIEMLELVQVLDSPYHLIDIELAFCWPRCNGRGRYHHGMAFALVVVVLGRIAHEHCECPHPGV